MRIRKLVLRHERLTDLTPADLSGVVFAGTEPTVPDPDCVSLDPCQATELRCLCSLNCPSVPC